MSKRWKAVAIAACALAGLLSADPGSAAMPIRADGPDASPAGRLQTAEEALDQDMRAIAKAAGWTYEQALAQHRASEAVGEVAVQVAEREPAAFVGSVLNAEPGGPPSLYVKGPASPTVRALAAAAPVAIEVVDNQPMNIEELKARQQRITDALKAQGFANLAVRFDLGRRGRMNAVVQRRTGRTEDPVAIRGRMPDGLGAEVEVRVQEEAVATDEAAYGGLLLTDGGTGVCTSGWSVYQLSTGTTGVQTAAHCNNGWTPDEIIDPGVGVHAWNLQPGRYFGVYGDTEWGTTPASEKALFWATANEYRRTYSVEPISAISVGDWVCGYGRTTNNGIGVCQSVNDTTVQCTVDGYTKTGVGVNNDFFTGGDSGGPRFVDNKAIGSHIGNCGAGEYFSPADYYDNAIGVRVRVVQTLPNRVKLLSGESLTSTDGRFSAIMQTDGNFVVNWNGHGPLWSTGTNGNSGATVTMQADGNLVVRRTNGTAAWASGTSGTGYYVTMQTDGNLVMYGSGGAKWSSGTCCH